MIYALLSGSLPFDDSTDQKEVKRMTLEDPLTFEPEVWENLSLESKDLLQ